MSLAAAEATLREPCSMLIEDVSTKPRPSLWTSERRDVGLGVALLLFVATAREVRGLEHTSAA
jgi:hypothetical protein